MEDEKFSSDGFECVFRRYIKDDPKRVVSFQEEQVKSEIAREIYELRNRAGLTRQELERLAGTAESVIEDIEEADYVGDFLLTAATIASALQRRVEVRFVEDQPKSSQRISI